MLLLAAIVLLLSCSNIYTADGTTPTESNGAETVDTSFTPADPLSFADHTLSLRAIDAVGNESEIASFTITITLEIGSQYGGGIVFYLDGSGGGWIADQIDLGSGTFVEAWSLCLDSTRSGYDDWVLPSLGQLRTMYSEKGVIGGFSGDTYWSSSTYQPTPDAPVSAYYKDFSIGQEFCWYLDEVNRVRAVREF